MNQRVVSRVAFAALLSVSRSLQHQAPSRSNVSSKDRQRAAGSMPGVGYDSELMKVVLPNSAIDVAHERNDEIRATLHDRQLRLNHFRGR